MVLRSSIKSAKRCGSVTWSQLPTTPHSLSLFQFSLSLLCSLCSLLHCSTPGFFLLCVSLSLSLPQGPSIMLYHCLPLSRLLSRPLTLSHAHSRSEMLSYSSSFSLFLSTRHTHSLPLSPCNPLSCVSIRARFLSRTLSSHANSIHCPRTRTLIHTHRWRRNSSRCGMRRRPASKTITQVSLPHLPPPYAPTSLSLCLRQHAFLHPNRQLSPSCPRFFRCCLCTRTLFQCAL